MHNLVIAAFDLNQAFYILQCVASNLIPASHAEDVSQFGQTNLKFRERRLHLPPRSKSTPPTPPTTKRPTKTSALASNTPTWSKNRAEKRRRVKKATNDDYNVHLFPKINMSFAFPIVVHWRLLLQSFGLIIETFGCTFYRVAVRFFTWRTDLGIFILKIVIKTTGRGLEFRHRLTFYKVANWYSLNVLFGSSRWLYRLTVTIRI